MELNEETGNAVFMIGQKGKPTKEIAKNETVDGRNNKMSQYTSQKGMVGITEAVPKTRIALDI